MVKQYVGARYVPKFANPVAWAPSTSYEALTIVTFNNASYTSKIPVPPTVGNPANNPQYWALTGNYNAQVEQYRQETETVSNSLTTEITNRKNADTALQGQITTEITDRKKADTALQNQITTGVTNKLKKVLLLLGDSWPNGAQHGPIIANTLKNYFDEVHNYALNGARLGQLAEQATTAKNAGVKPTVIYIICGSNDVFHDHAISTNISDVLTQLNTLYPGVPKHYFPDNSKTGNMGYTYLYGTICNYFSQNGMIPHIETLAYLTTQAFYFFMGSNTIGVQHLSEVGEKWFANICYMLANGGNDMIYPAYFDEAALHPCFTYPSGITVNKFEINSKLVPDGSGMLEITLSITNATGNNLTNFALPLTNEKLTNLPIRFRSLGLQTLMNSANTEPAAAIYGNDTGLSFHLFQTLANGAQITLNGIYYISDVLDSTFRYDL